MLSVWYSDHAKPVKHVCQLHPLTSGHYRRYSEASHCSMVQRVQQILAASQELDQSRTGIERAVNILCEANKRAAKGQHRQSTSILPMPYVNLRRILQPHKAEQLRTT